MSINFFNNYVHINYKEISDRWWRGGGGLKWWSALVENVQKWSVPSDELGTTGMDEHVHGRFIRSARIVRVTTTR